jgi:KUP system potassium uptake protein
MRQSWAEFGAALRMAPPMRTRGAAAFLALSVDAVPIPLSRLFALTGAIPENVLLVAVESLEIPTVLPEDHIEVIPEDNGLRRVILRYGFTDLISVPKALSVAVEQGKLKPADLDGLVVYSGSETVIPSRTVPGMVFWREALFGFMHRNAERSAAYFCIPPDRVIDVGTEIEI